MSPKTTTSSRCAGRIRPSNGSRSRNCRCPYRFRREPSGSLRIDTGERARFDEHKSPKTHGGSLRPLIPAYAGTCKKEQTGSGRTASSRCRLIRMSHIFFELHPKLSRALRRIRKTRLVYEREADGGLVW